MCIRDRRGAGYSSDFNAHTQGDHIRYFLQILYAISVYDYYKGSGSHVLHFVTVTHGRVVEAVQSNDNFRKYIVYSNYRIKLSKSTN